MRPSPRFSVPSRGTRVLVVGLGLHGGGAATVRFLARRGCRVRVTDVRSARELSRSLAGLHGVRFERRFGGHRVADVRWAEVVVQNPAVPRSHPLIRTAHALGKPVLNDAVLFLSFAPGPVIAVTGTRGKSTTVALTAAMLGVPRAGLSREPELSVLPRLRLGEPVVVEFSSWQCERLGSNRVAPDVAVLTNLSPDHLNRYSSFAAYAAAKAKLFRWQSPKDSFGVVNREDPVARTMGLGVRGHRAWFALHPFSEEDGTFLERGWFTVRSRGTKYRIAPRSMLRLPGDHVSANALAALAATWWVRPDVKRIRRALVTFRGLPGRQELIATHRGVRYINDTTATSPAGTLAALAVYRRTHPVLIAGGVDKDLEFSELVRAIGRSCSAVVLLPGSATDRLRGLLPRRILTVSVNTMEDAVHRAAGLARKGSAVLLSPAAASFNLFRHEYERGAAFAHAVGQLA